MMMGRIIVDGVSCPRMKCSPLAPFSLERGHATVSALYRTYVLIVAHRYQFPKPFSRDPR